MGYGGTPIDIPERGHNASPGVLYVARCRFGYGTTAAGSSDGAHVWTSTNVDASMTLFNLNTLIINDTACSTNYDSDASPPLWGGIMVHELWTVVKVAFTASVTLCVGDCTDSDGWALASDIGCTSTGISQPASSAVNKPAYGALGKGPMLYNSTDPELNKISVVVGGADPVVGIMDVYMVYSLADEMALANSDWPDTLGS